MKQICIFFILFLFLISCTNDQTTKQVKRHNVNERTYIKDVCIVDTISYEEVLKQMSYDTAAINLLKRKIQVLEEMEPSIRGSLFSRSKIHDFFKILYRLRDDLEYKESKLKLFERLYLLSNGDICAYIVIMEYRNHVDSFVLDPNYRIIGLTFLYKLDKIE